MVATRSAGLTLLAMLVGCSGPLKQSDPAGPTIPNTVGITPRLVTSGQPSAEALLSLGAQGFSAVVHLAPLHSRVAVEGEPELVGRQGLVYINIPLASETPTESDYMTFAALLGAMVDRKVLVHCEVNARASTMVFLFRVINGRIDPHVAYESVRSVWTPDERWKSSVEGLLSRFDVRFTPY